MKQKKSIGIIVCLSWIRIFMMICLLSLSFCVALQAQTVFIKGVVKDQQGYPIIGASVYQKNLSQKGVITDKDGKFEIGVALKSTLVISYVGYMRKEIVAISNKTLLVVLSENVHQLDEMVVIGYGTQKKVSVTGSVASISNEDLKKSSAARLDNALAGRITGLISTQKGGGQPGVDGATMYLRGISTVNGADPLILIDGVSRGTIGQIDPNEVESVSVLKDASATAVFGVRGANGVILITTKHGQKGKPKLSVSVEQSFTSFSREYKRLHSWDYMTYRNEACTNDGLDKEYSDEQISKFKNPLWGLDSSDPNYSKDVIARNYLFCDHYYLDEFFKKSTPQTKFNTNVSGGSEKVSYFFNVGYIHQGGNLKTESKQQLGYDPSSKMDRISLRTNLDYNVTNSLKASMNIGTYIETVNMPDVGALYQGSASAMMTDLFYNASIMLPIQSGPLTIAGYGLPAGMMVHPRNMDRSPFEVINRRGYSNATTINLNSQISLEWDLSKLLTKGLSLKGMVAYDNYGTTTKQGDKVEADYWITTNYDKGTFVYTSREQNTYTLGVSRSFSSYYAINAQAMLNYHRAFGLHDVSGMFVTQRDYWESGADLPYNVVGVAARGTYAYDSRYLAEFNIGYNGSEQFAPSKRFGFFPALSLGWVISNEVFMKSINWLDNLKLRFSAGRVGNDKEGGYRFLYIDHLTISSGKYVQGLGSSTAGTITQGLLGNHNITWELADKRNYGLDVNLFKSLFFSFDYYSENRKHILIDRQSVPSFQGVSLSNLPKANIGRAKNQGFEMELTYSKNLKKDWHIQFKVNFATNKNKLLFDDEPIRTDDYTCRYRYTGYSIGQAFGYKIDKSSNNGYYISKDEISNSGLTYSFGTPRPGDFKYVDTNKDGVINEKDQVPIKYTSVPGISYGLSFQTSYKGFDFSIFFQGLGHYSGIYSGKGVYENVSDEGFYYNYQRNAWTEDRWINHKKITYPALTTQHDVSQQPNDFFIQNRAFVRLKNLELGYTLSKSCLNFIGIKSCRFFVGGENLYCWSHLKSDHLDPEQDSPVSYPITKMVNLGFNVNF